MPENARSTRLRDEAQTIWRAGVEAVESERLVRSALERSRDALIVCGHEFPLARLQRLIVVGAGKAGAGMAAGLEQALGDELLEERVTGWINVPADCVRVLKRIQLHPARPAGVNEPTAAGVEGSRRILQLVSELRPDDLCLVLISGGGSALLPAPVPEVGLDAKQAVTRLLMKSGATIDELNLVRRHLSHIKGGKLAASAPAGTVVGLVISDVIGDPLDVIASGPTVPDHSSSAEALAVLQRYAARPDDVPARVWDYLSRLAGPPRDRRPLRATVFNHVIGNNATALSACARKAEELGYAVHSLGSRVAGEARKVGYELAELCLTVRERGAPVAPPACLLSGGEPVVHLTETDRPRSGGRNQELVLAAAERLWNEDLRRIVLLSGGTDGEDGPTDAAGAFLDAGVLHSARALRLDPAEFLAINNSYPFFERSGGLLKTGPTHTNVMDLRVAVVGR